MLENFICRSNPTVPIRVLITESRRYNERIISKFLKRCQAIYYVGNAADEFELTQQLFNSAVDVLMLDIKILSQNYLDFLSFIQLSYPRLKVIVYCDLYDENSLNNVIALGAKGFLPKDMDLIQIIEAVNHVYSGGTYFACNKQIIFSNSELF